MKPLQLRPLNEITYIIIRSCRNRLFYFNSEGIIESVKYDSLDFLCEKRPENNNIMIERNTYNQYNIKFLSISNLEKYIITELDYDIEMQFNNEHHIWKENITVDEHSRFNELKYMVGKIKEGMTYKEVQDTINFASAHFNKNGTYIGLPFSELKGIDKYVISMKPIILRDPENPNKNTFDMIKVQADLITKEDRFEYIKAHKKELIYKAIKKIAESRSFQKYHVPVNILRCTKVHAISIYTVEVIFELKGV